MSRHTAEETKQQYFEAMGHDLGSFFYCLYNECVFLHWKWRNYIILYGTKPERIDLLNSAAPSFFRLIQDSLFEDIILHISRLMDPPKSVGKANLTLLALPRMLNIEARSEAENLLELTKNKCDFARDWRNRHLAHRDLNLAVELSAKPLAEASRRSVKGALEAIGGVLNAVDFRYTGSTVAYDHPFPGPGDAESLLHVLRDGVTAEAAQRERWRSGRPVPEDMVLQPDI